MAVDYSVEDLKQLLSVSSLDEYALSAYSLHNTFKGIVSDCEKSGAKCIKNNAELADEINMGIAEDQLVLKDYTSKTPSELSSLESTLPPLFNTSGDEGKQDETFAKNLEQYRLVYKVLFESYSSLGDTDKKVSASYETFMRKCEAWESQVKGAVDTSCRSGDEAAATAVDTNAQDVSGNVCETKPNEDVDSAEAPGGVEYDALADLCESMSASTQQFLENYDTLYSGKKSVTDCIAQLKQFSAKGLQVGAAIAPLNEQLESFTGLQNKYVDRLGKLNDAFKELMSDMDKDMADALVKQL